jgi:hypothetical protein
MITGDGETETRPRAVVDQRLNKHAKYDNASRIRHEK